MNSLPPQIQQTATPRPASNTALRLILVFVGLVIGFSPALFFLIEARELDHLLERHVVEIAVCVGIASLLGSILCLKPFIPKWWIVLLCLPFLAAGFFVTCCGAGLFLGCISAFSN